MTQLPEEYTNTISLGFQTRPDTEETGGIFRISTWASWVRECWVDKKQLQQIANEILHFLNPRREISLDQKNFNTSRKVTLEWLKYSKWHYNEERDFYELRSPSNTTLVRVDGIAMAQMCPLRMPLDEGPVSFTAEPDTPPSIMGNNAVLVGDVKKP